MIQNKFVYSQENFNTDLNKKIRAFARICTFGRAGLWLTPAPLLSKRISFWLRGLLSGANHAEAKEDVAVVRDDADPVRNRTGIG